MCTLSLLVHSSEERDPSVQVDLSCLIVSHVPHQAKLSPQAFSVYSRYDFFQILLNPLAETFGKSSYVLNSLIIGNVSFHLNDDGRHMVTTFSLDERVLD